MIEVRTPSRLHFGLLAFDGSWSSRQFGGVGLMIRYPDVKVQIELASDFTGAGRMSDRAVEFAKRFATNAIDGGLIERDDLPGVSVRVVRVPRPHTGLGTGTQLGMAVGRALTRLVTLDDAVSPAQLAMLVGRGQRSAVGVHGCFGGGFLVEGGKVDPGAISPKLMQLTFPDDWRIVLIRPIRLVGTAGQRERQAFANMPRFELKVTARMCQLVLMGMAPAVVERDLSRFGEALFELQQRVGQCFTTVQGGTYGDPSLEEIVSAIRLEGVTGVGQSSWGPTLYAVTGDQDRAEHLVDTLQRRFGLEHGEIGITKADNHGASVKDVRSAVRSD